jgi:hypothetical protein
VGRKQLLGCGSAGGENDELHNRSRRVRRLLKEVDESLKRCRMHTFAAETAGQIEAKWLI